MSFSRAFSSPDAEIDVCFKARKSIQPYTLILMLAGGSSRELKMTRSA